MAGLAEQRRGRHVHLSSYLPAPLPFTTLLLRKRCNGGGTSQPQRYTNTGQGRRYDSTWMAQARWQDAQTAVCTTLNWWPQVTKSRHHWIRSSAWLLETCNKVQSGFLPSEKFPVINFRGSVQCSCSRSDAEVWRCGGRAACWLSLQWQWRHGIPHMALRNCPVGFRELEESARVGGLWAHLERPAGFSQSTCGGMEKRGGCSRQMSQS